jgi:hypothetical protein
MMPCKYCEMDLAARGLKQVGKTRYVGTLFVRRYRCQDCSAAMIWSGDLGDKTSLEERWFPPGTFAVPARERGRIRLRPPARADGEPSSIGEPGSSEEAA